MGDRAPGSRASCWSPLSAYAERGTGGEDPKGEGIKGVRTREIGRWGLLEGCQKPIDRLLPRRQRAPQRPLCA